MTQRDDHTDDRRRPAGPAWATVPTMQWSRVPQEEREDDDPQRRREQDRRPDGDPAVPLSPAVGEANGGAPGGTGPGGPGGARGVARPGVPPPFPPPAEASAAVRFVTRRNDAPRGDGPPGDDPRGAGPRGAGPRGAGRRTDGPPGAAGYDDGHYDSGARGMGQTRPAEDRPAATGWWGDTNQPDQRRDPRGPDRRPDERPPGDERRGGVGRPNEGLNPPGRGAGRASVPTAPAAPAAPPGPRPRQPVFVGPGGIPAGLRPDLLEALTAPTPPGGVRPTQRHEQGERYEQGERHEQGERYEQVERYGPADPRSEPVRAARSATAPPRLDSPPMSAPPVSAPPSSAPPSSAPPSSAPPSSGLPVSGLPTSAPPLFDAAPMSAPPVSALPTSGPPLFDAAPTSAPPSSGPPAAPDPEQILSGWEWVFDPDTLREVAEDREGLEEIRDALTTKLNGHEDNAPRARLLSLRAVVSRILGDLQKALADGKLALAHAEATGELRRIAIAQARLAHVLQWRGEFEEADRLFTLANSTELPDRLRATMYQHSGKCAYDQGRYIEACNHFEKALELRKAEDPEMIAHTELALDAVFRRVAENGWGPYPRTRDQILQLRRPPTPAMDERTGQWGFTDENGDTKVPAVYGDVQPYRDGVAWVQRPGQESWELIDESGQTLIPAGAGYLGVSSFSDGLAWVSRDGTARWIAIDKANTVTISTGFEDVRPFRRGMAAVRRGGRWGAVDGIGRQVVAFRYDSFATALSDGRYIDGFSDEGLAVVELSGRKGVVDRAGRVLVEPVYPALVIHPVAFLITDGAHRWGALDRRGRLLIAPSHPSRMAVTEEIDRLLVDARPML